MTQCSWFTGWVASTTIQSATCTLKNRKKQGLLAVITANVPLATVTAKNRSREQSCHVASTNAQVALGSCVLTCPP